MYDSYAYIISESRPMTTISIRDLGRRPSQVVDEVIRTGRPAIITRHGRPVTAMVALDPDELEDFVLARAPEFARSMRAAGRPAGRTRAAPPPSTSATGVTKLRREWSERPRR